MERIYYIAKSKLVILLEKKGEGKLNVAKYVEEIIDKKLFEFQIMSMEAIGYIYVMKDRALYYKRVIAVRRKQYKEDN